VKAIDICIRPTASVLDAEDLATKSAAKTAPNENGFKKRKMRSHKCCVWPVLVHSLMVNSLWIHLLIWPAHSTPAHQLGEKHLTDVSVQRLPSRPVVNWHVRASCFEIIL
jgi:hypothetical protein